MKIIINKILILFIIIFLLIFIKKEVTPFYFGNITFKIKYEDYNKRNEKFNAAVFGSSFVFRQINTLLFDSLLNKYELSTYNFGTISESNPESYFLYENFLQNIDSGDIKIAILELQSLRYYLPSNQRTTRATYWNNKKYLKYSINYIKDSHYPKEKKYGMYKSYIESYLYSFVDFSILENLIRQGDAKQLGVNGFYHLDKVMIDKKGENTIYSRRWANFHSGRSKLRLEERVNAAQIVTESIPQEAVNKSHLKLLNHLIKASYNKGVHLFLFVPPRLTESQYIEVVGISNALPFKNSIQLYQYPKYRELYEVVNSFDYGHLNRKGADIFTKYLAIEVDNINARTQKYIDTKVDPLEF